MKTILIDAINTFVIKGEGINQAMYELLEKYPNPKIIVTNANDEQMAMHGLDNMPYPVFTLKHNPNKPDPIYFETLLNKYQLDADNVVYCEHNEDAVASARSVGITSYYYDYDKGDLVALAGFLEGNLVSE